MNKKRTIQETTIETGVSAETLRYYERIGLITDIERATNGHRRYNDLDILWINFLKQLRATGMSIAQMQEFAELRKGRDATISQRREVLEAYRAHLLQEIASIQEFIALIDTKIERHKQHEEQRAQATIKVEKEPS